MKRLIIYLLLLSLIGCDKLILRKDTVKKIPFKFEKGVKTINFYKIDYPKDLKEKESFYKKLSIFLQKTILKKAKYSIVFDKSFFDEEKNIKKFGLLTEEKIITKEASSLTENEIKYIKKLTDKKIKRFAGTTQELLNLQVYFLYLILNEENKFISDDIYTELDKELLLNKLRVERKKFVLLKKKANIDYIVYINKLKNKINEDLKDRYYYTKVINLDMQDRISSTSGKYTNPVYIDNINIEDLKQALELQKLKNKCIILENKEYTGYKYLNNEFLLFINGKRNIKEFKEYDLKLSITKSNFKDLLDKKEDFILKDFIGGR